MELLAQFFQLSFIVIALGLNFIIMFIKDYIKFKRKNKPIPFLTQYLQMLLFLFSFILVYLGLQTNQITCLIDNSVWITSGWVAILSITVYDIGFKNIMEEIKKLFLRFLGKN